jgi:hypothetical protein
VTDTWGFQNPIICSSFIEYGQTQLAEEELDIRKSFKMRDLRRAGDETRTRDIFLGKEVLYQLSYTRVLSMRGRNDASDAGRIKKYLRAIDSVNYPRWVTHLPEEPRARI